MQAKISLGKLGLYLFCLFPVLPSLQAQSALAMLLIVLQIIAAVQNRKDRSSIGFGLPILLLLPTLSLVLSLLYSEDLHHGLKYLERSVLLVVLPILFFLNRKEFDRKLQVNLLRFLALVMTLFSWYAIISILATGKLMLVLPYSNSYYFIREFVSAKTQLHPTYFSILLAIPAFGIQQELREAKLGLWPRLILLFMLASLGLGILMASSKMIMAASLVGSAVIWTQGRDWRVIVKWTPVVILTLAALTYFIDPLHDRATDLIKALSEKGIDQNNPDSMRKAIYYSTYHAISEAPWFGVGIGDVPATLSANYERFGFSDALEKGYNTHNYYLHMWLAAGIIPFLIFIGVQAIQVLIGIVSRNSAHLAISLLFSLSLLTENLLSRQVGIFSYAFFGAFMAFTSWSKAKEQIFINGRFLSQKLSGVQRYAREVSKYLMAKGPEVQIIAPKLDHQEALKHQSLPIFKGQVWEQITLPVYLWLKGSPALINLGNSGPILYRNNYLTLHDVAFMENPQWFSPAFVSWYRFMIPRLLKKVRRVFTVSEFSKQEISKHFSLAADKISVSYNGLAELPDPSNIGAPLLAKPYVLAVGTLSARKNQKTIIDVFLQAGEQLPFNLVLVGAYDPNLYSDLEAYPDKIRQASNIIWYQDADDERLANLYHHARVCLYLPLYEGFGLPVLESLAYQKLSVVSDIPVFRELFQDLVLFSPPANRKGLTELLKSLAEDPSSLKVKSLDRAELEERYSYKRSADFIFDQLNG